MANFYKNAFYDPSTTAAVTVYTCPSNANAIVQNIQVTNQSGSKVVKTYVYDFTTTTNFEIAYASISGPTICNLAKGPIILEESDTLVLSSTSNTTVSGTVSILEVNRGLIQQ